ncbi:MAG: PQQ-dependent sugar dehydrogenase [Aquisalimonadaceae bacterium]
MVRTIMHCAATLLLSAALAGVATAQIHDSENHRFRVDILTDDLAHPWGLAFLPDGRMLITERPGRLQLFDPESGDRTSVEGTPEVAAVSQGGLLDVVLHPNHADNGWIYLSYSAPGDGGNATTVGRGRLRSDRLTDFEVLFTAAPRLGGGRHFGSRLVFDNDGYLYISSGDRGERDRAQTLDNHQGKILRLTDEGRVPPDNPLVGDDDALPEIYSWGHRNPQGMILHPETGKIWVHEHGPRGGDEINIVRAGSNYGWPKVTHGREYHGPEIGPDGMQGMESPIHHWTPSIAPSGMAYYDGDAFPEWRGNVFVGALALTHLARLELDGKAVTHEERLLDDAGWRIRDVRRGPDGYLYVLVDARRAPLLRLSPAD